MPKRSAAEPLTDPAIRALRPGATPIDIRDTLARGLILTVHPSGRRQFCVRYVFGGKHKRLVLGDFPKGMSLAKARREAERVRSAIRDGADPVAERAAAKAERTDTVDTLAAEYLRLHARKFKRSADEDARILEVDVLPFWRDRSVRELTRRDVRALIERKADAAPVMANRLLAVVRKMLNFAVDHDWIDANPASRVKKPAPETSRDRVLTHDEIRRLWRLLSHFPTTAQRPAPGRRRADGEADDPLCPVSPWLAAALKVRLLTAQRGGEVARMRWTDLELERAKDGTIAGGWWTIPGEYTKNAEPHRVPITADVAAIIEGQEPKDGERRGVYVFSFAGGAAAIDRSKKASAALARALGIDFRGHDLRRTAATGMAEAGIPREHIARVLNHIEGGARATKVYDRYSYDPQKKIALDTWTRTLQGILNGTGPRAAVVPFKTAK